MDRQDSERRDIETAKRQTQQGTDSSDTDRQAGRQADRQTDRQTDKSDKDKADMDESMR